MTQMCRSDRRLTDKISTDESLLATAVAIDALPSFTQAISAGVSQKLGAGGHSTSLGATSGGGAEVAKPIMNTGESHTLTQTVAEWRLQGNGGSGGARTRNLCRDRAAL